jgi:hypothetical protein
MRPQKRFEQIQINVPALGTATKFIIGDIPNLRSDVEKDVIIRAIETFTVDSMPTDFNGVPVTTMANLLNASLTLYIQGEESVHAMPIVKLLNVQNEGAAYFFTEHLNEFQNLMVDWTKSYISLNTPIAPPATQFDFVLGIGYQKLKAGTITGLRKAAGCSDNSYDVPSL